ncbi:MAG: hypothetical protein RO257_00240 [Candidatus Kapabacteria bacterium]|nr:hypothetical protein [Candidatus Kapabacteria bacterium]
MKILLMLFLLTVLNVFAQSEDNKESDSIYYSNLFKDKVPPVYYLKINIKNNDTVYSLILSHQSLYFILKDTEMFKKYKEFNEIVKNILIKKDTLILRKNCTKSFEQFLIPEKYQKITDSIASLGQEYFLDYYFNTTDYEGIKQYRGVINYDKFQKYYDLDKVQFKNAVIYHLIKWRLYVFHQGYTGNLVFCKEENIEKAIQKR